jgi:S-adenosylmethionine:tRNA ribosyltransferase-isomerase
MSELKTEDFDYDLPEELVAYMPAGERTGSRLMVLDRRSGSVEHSEFARIGGYLGSGDLLVLNDTRVFRARLVGRKEGTGGRVELLLLRERGPGRWEAMVSPSRRVHAGTGIELGGGYRCRISERLEGPRRLVEFSTEDVFSMLEEIGKVPLPPYIKREEESLDGERYQTVYARRRGSVAAPTAGLHFSERLLAGLESKGIEITALTLHVGVGTFVPVKEENPGRHVLEPEYFELGENCARAVNRTRRGRGRVVAVGTTAVRALETAADRAGGGELGPEGGWTGKYILPPYRFQAVDAMVTNFHLPRSTLLMLVCAFAGREFILEAYRSAIARRYRFFSYGDAMLIR